MSLPLAARARDLQPSLTLAITARARQLRSEGRDICSLSAGEPDFDTPAFIRQAAAMLKRGGTLWMVANRHLPYEAELKAAFKRVTPLEEGGGFKLFEAVK